MRSFKGDFIEQPFCLKDYMHHNAMTSMPLSFDISDDNDFELPDLKPVLTKQSTLVCNLQPVSWFNTSNVDDIDIFPNSLFSASAVNMDVDSMNGSK